MFSKSALDELVATEAQPTVSIYLPTHVAGREIGQDPIRLKNLVSLAAERLAACRRGPKIDAFLAPARRLIGDSAFWRHQRQGLAVFLAPDFGRVHKLPIAAPEEVVLGSHFHLKPLFWLLTLSAAHTRLLPGRALGFRRSARARPAARRRRDQGRDPIRGDQLCPSDRSTRRVRQGAVLWRRTGRGPQGRIDRAVASSRRLSSRKSSAAAHRSSWLPIRRSRAISGRLRGGGSLSPKAFPKTRTLLQTRSCTIAPMPRSSKGLSKPARQPLIVSKDCSAPDGRRPSRRRSSARHISAGSIRGSSAATRRRAEKRSAFRRLPSRPLSFGDDHPTISLAVRHGCPEAGGLRTRSINDPRSRSMVPIQRWRNALRFSALHSASADTL